MSSAIKAIAKTLVYKRTATVDRVLRDLIGVGAFDKRQEKVQGVYKLVGIAGAAVGALGILLLALKLDASIGVALLLVGVVTAAIAFARWSHHRTLNFEDRRYLLLGEVLPLLRTDMAVDAEVTARLDFRRATEASKLTKKGRVGRWNVLFYDDPWMQLQGRFLDGTAFRCVVSERTQIRKRKSRSASGRVKHKEKTKASTRVQVALRPKAHRYPGLDQLVPRVQSAVKSTVQLPARVELKSLEYRGRAVVLKVAATNRWSPRLRVKGQLSGPDMIAMLFVSLYQVMNFARRSAGRRPA